MADIIIPPAGGPRIMTTGGDLAEKFGIPVLPTFLKKYLTCKVIKESGVEIMSFPVIYKDNQLVALAATAAPAPSLKTNLIRMQYSGNSCWVSAEKPVASTFTLTVEYKTKTTVGDWELVNVQFNKGTTESARKLFMVPIIAVNTEKRGVAHEDDTYSYEWDWRQFGQ